VEAAVRAKPAIARWVWWGGFFTVGVTAVVLSWFAYHDIVPGPLRAHDKATHFIIAGTLVFFLDGALKRRAFRIGALALSIAWLVVLLPSGMDEFLQRYSICRTSEISDYLADVAGATVFLWLSRRFDAGR
jgi:VanZ family protein